MQLFLTWLCHRYVCFAGRCCYAAIAGTDVPELLSLSRQLLIPGYCGRVGLTGVFASLVAVVTQLPLTRLGHRSGCNTAGGC